MLSFLMITFQRMAPKSLKQMVLGYKRGKRPGKGLHLKWANREFTTVSFLKKCSKTREVSDLLSVRNLFKVESSQGK